MWEDIKTILCVIPMIIVKLIAFVISVLLLVISASLLGHYFLQYMGETPAALLAVLIIVPCVFVYAVIEEYLLQQFYYFYVQYFVRMFIIKEDTYLRTLSDIENLHVRITWKDIRYWATYGRYY